MFVSFIVCSIICATKESETFIIKKEKSISAAVLKEECCEKVFDTICLSPRPLKDLAQCQEHWLILMPTMVDGSFFNKKDKKTLEKNAQTITKVLERQQTINQLIKQQVADLEALQSI